MQERKELRVDDPLAAFPKGFPIRPLHFREDVQIRIYFGEALPRIDGGPFI
jgi:hypothetical protein